MVAAGCYKPTVNESETMNAAEVLWAVRRRGRAPGFAPIERS